MKTALYARCITLACLTPILVNCSGMSFANGGSGSPGAASVTPVQPVTPPSKVAVPELKFVGPPCPRGTSCQVQFNMLSSVSGTFEFDWQTNDTLYLQTPPAGEIYGKPNVDYVPSSGHVLFAPGQTVEQVNVQNVSSSTSEMVIGVLMDNCSYNGVAGDCTTFFQ